MILGRECQRAVHKVTIFLGQFIYKPTLNASLNTCTSNTSNIKKKNIMRSTQLLVALACFASFVNAATVNIVVGPGLTFTPQQATANVGDTIVWTFKADHSVMESDASGSCTASTKAGAFSSSQMSSGTFTYTATTAGTLFYFCGVDNHCQLGMTGSLVVGAAASNSSASASASASASSSTSGSASAASSTTTSSSGGGGGGYYSGADYIAPGVTFGIMAVAGVGAILAL